MEYFKEMLVEQNIDPQLATALSYIGITLLLIILCVLANFITKKIVLRMITLIITKNKFTWDDKLLERGVFQKLSHIVPAIIIFYFASAYSSYQELIEKGAFVYMTAVIISVMNAFLNTINDIYLTYEVSKVRPIKGFIQVAKIVVFFVGFIVLLSTLLGQNPLILLSGLGALSAVLMLIFQNSILGLVAGVQLSANDMVRVGDWIEMPKYNADGDVLEINLTTVKVQNWDKTITMIPAAAFINDSFKNWRGMQETGGRRIKRAIYIDVTSIQFCTDEMIEKFKSIHYLKDYVTSKEEEIHAYNEEQQIDPSVKVNGRRLTNIGTYRVYIEHYLAHNEKLHKNLTSMVRQLAPGEHGLPIEIYTFTNDVRWAAYEAIQADIFDHLLAAASEFGLKVFQNPTGYDMRGLLGEPVRQTR